MAVGRKEVSFSLLGYNLYCIFMSTSRLKSSTEKYLDSFWVKIDSKCKNGDGNRDNVQRKGEAKGVDRQTDIRSK